MSPVPAQGLLDVPGATLYYKARGTGPVLLTLQSGGGDADASDDLAAALAGQYTVVAFDRRGLSRSQITDPAHPRGIQTHSDDASRLLAAFTSEPALVFGSSIGALIGLDLVTAHPQQVRLLVAHEAPVPSVLAEPGQTSVRALQRDVEDTFRAEGLFAAMRKVFALAGGFGDDPDPEVKRPVPATGQVARHTANLEFFLAQDVPKAHRYEPSLAALKAAAASILPAAGVLSRGSFPYQSAQSLADQLGRPLAEFPGGHAGHGQRPRAFAQTLHQALTGHAPPA